LGGFALAPRCPHTVLERPKSPRLMRATRGL